MYRPGLDGATARARRGRRALVPAADPRLQSSQAHARGLRWALGLARLAWLPWCCGEDVESSLFLDVIDEEGTACVGARWSTLL
jgi:hypothetical protein